MLPLFYHHYKGHHPKPNAPSIIILHGLLGSSRNWKSIAQILSQHYSVWTLDMRNHGQSPHITPHTYEAMVQDIYNFITIHDLSNSILLGHSMGGKVAMLFAMQFPDIIQSLIVIDIAPKVYIEVHYAKEFKAMGTIPLASITNRQKAAEYFRQFIDDESHIQFLLTNLIRDNDSFKWQINLPILIEALSHLASNPLSKEAQYFGETLFIRGKKSHFIRDEDVKTIKHHFPSAKIITLEHSGHNPHIDQQSLFCDTIHHFLLDKTL